jgi:hypothetical protein
MMTQSFDWHCGPIDRATVIDAHYTNTQNVRRFFKHHIGEHFTFNRPFMQWMKNSSGKTMGEAVDQWLSDRRHHD